MNITRPVLVEKATTLSFYHVIEAFELFNFNEAECHDFSLYHLG